MSNKTKGAVLPEQVQAEYRQATDYKRQLGDRGLYEQNRINERFYSGDQWHGANCGDSRPLVRYNVIKRIGDYKMAVIGAQPLAVRFSAEGVPVTAASRDLVERIPGATYCETLPQVTEFLRANVQEGDIVLTVGAGDIYKAGDALLK